MPSSPLRRRRVSGWTAERQGQFITDLRGGGSVQQACAAAGLSRAGVYKLRDRNTSFAKSWDTAVMAHHRDLLNEAHFRVEAGTVRPVIHRGHVVGERTVYSDRLLIAALLRGKADMGEAW